MSNNHPHIITNNLKDVDKANVIALPSQRGAITTTTTIIKPPTAAAATTTKTATPIASSTTITSSALCTSTTVPSTTVKRRIDSMSDEEILQENLKELIDRKSREERKANGRLIAVIVAFLVIFLAIYHAWIRKSTLLAGVIVPAVIMISYGGWVVILAKRDKRRRALFEKHLEEVALRNKVELEEKVKQKGANKKAHATTLHYEHEKSNGQPRQEGAASTGAGQPRRQRKHRRARRLNIDGGGSGGDGGGSGDSGIGSSNSSASRHAATNKDLRLKRPSIRQKLFKQNAAVTKYQQSASTVKPSDGGHGERMKRLQRMDTLAPMPPLVRMSSAPS